MADEQSDVVIKKVKKRHRGHEGNAATWKIAYADFVTAMMAFFLLLWLLSATDAEQKQGIADYFAPSTQISSSQSGADGLLAGLSIAQEGAMVSNLSNIGIEMNLTPEEKDGERADGQEISAENQEKQQQIQFEQVTESLQVAIEENPELEDLSDNVLIDVTPEGVRIQLVDEENMSMFASGSSQLAVKSEILMALVADAIKDTPQKIRISGHTDAKPFASGTVTNWELSSERANASRRALVKGGLKSERIQSVVGLADTDILVKDDPFSPQNRRISITLLKESLVTPVGGAPRQDADSGFRTIDVDNF